MSRLAAKYGVSGNDLAKICNRLNVPYPGREHWARKEAGQKVIQYRLPDPEEETPLKVTISPTRPPPPSIPKELEEKLTTARQETTAIAAPERLVRLHPPDLRPHRSVSICGRPASAPDFQRQYQRKAARCQRTSVSGWMIVMALRIEGNHRYSWMKNKRSLVSRARPCSLLPQHDQLISERRVLSFKSALRLEWRGQDGKEKTDTMLPLRTDVR
jgi:hypothetical protein